MLTDLRGSNKPRRDYLTASDFTPLRGGFTPRQPSNPTVNNRLHRGRDRK